MNMHKNARLTPRGRERIVRQVASGQTPKAVARYPNPRSGLEVAPGAAKVRPEKGPIGASPGRQTRTHQPATAAGRLAT